MRAFLAEAGLGDVGDIGAEVRIVVGATFILCKEWRTVAWSWAKNRARRRHDQFVTWRTHHDRLVTAGAIALSLWRP